MWSPTRSIASGSRDGLTDTHRRRTRSTERLPPNPPKSPTVTTEDTEDTDLTAFVGKLLEEQDGDVPRGGTIELAIPKVTPGSYFPSLLQPRRRASTRWRRSSTKRMHGVSTRKVDEARY